MMTVKDKILAILLALAFNAFAAAWTGSTSEPENMKKIDGKAFYVITTADELAWFAAQVNSGKTAINAVLENDIVFGASTTKRSSQRWIPIGKDSSHIFNGILDGAGKTIYGLFATNEKFLGLIGIVGSSGIVRNLSLKNGKRSFVSYVPKWVSGIAALNSGKISNCENGDTISFSATNDFKDDFDPVIGGVVAENKGNVEDCVNGGLLDVTVDSYYYTYLGGVSGRNSGNVVHSENKASLKFVDKNTNSGGTYYTDIGGSVGGCIGLNKKNINACKNIGAINATAHYIQTGGILGYNSGTITNCANHGMISIASRYSGGRKNVGGVVGVNSSQNFSNSYSVANIDSKNSVGTVNVGGVVGLNRKSVKNSFFNSTVFTKGSPIGIDSGSVNNVSGMTTANMQKDQFAWILNTTNGTTSNSGVWSRTDGYPIFATETNKPIYKVVFNDEGVTTNRYTSNKGLASFPENPEPAEGFVFTGWYNANDVRVKPTTVFTADQTLNAVYVDASEVFWTINFFNTDAKSTLLETKSYQHGSVVAYGGETPTKETTAQYTYTFKGWDVEPTNAVEDFDYHAVYDSTIRSYVITFNNYDGTKIESDTFEYGKMPSCSKTPSRATTAEWKYTHKGWRPALDYVTEDASYTALFDSSKVEYKVTFMNGTTVIDEQMVPYGGAAVAPTDVTREGYKFVGWNATFANVTENLTVKALFEELITYIVKVIGPNDEKIDSVKVEENGTYVLPTAPKKDGYTFDAYYDGDNKIGIAGTGISVVGDITITAKYSKNPESSSSSVPKSSSSSAKSSSSNGDSQVVVEGELEQTVSPGAYIDPIIFKNVKKYNRNSSHISFIQALPSQGSDELAIVGLVPEYYKAGVYTESWTINGLIYTVKLTVVSNSSSSSAKPSSSSAKTSIAMQKNMPHFNVSVGLRRVQISGAKIGASYVLLDMQGRVLQKGRVESANFNVAVPNAGQYFVRIDNQIRSVNVK